MADELVTIESKGKVAVARVQRTPRLDQANTDDFGKALMAYLEANPGAHLLVSLEGIAFITSSVLSELIQAMRFAAKDGGSVRVCALTDYVASVFEVTHLDKAFKVGGAVDEALAAYNEDLEAVIA